MGLKTAFNSIKDYLIVSNFKLEMETFNSIKDYREDGDEGKLGEEGIFQFHQGLSRIIVIINGE